jgi:hypothetical protein
MEEHQIMRSCVGFKVLTAVVMESTIFWDITPCSPLKINRRLGGKCRLRLQGRRISRGKTSGKAGREILKPSI